MELDKVIVRNVKMELKSPFTTSFGTFFEKEFLLLEAIDKDGVSGWGESVAFPSPWYIEETVRTNEHMLQDFLLPSLLKQPIAHPDEVSERFAPIRRNNMAKSAIEGAIWDLYAKKNGVPLYQALSGEKTEIDVGISIGIEETVKDQLNVIEKAVGDGYKRIKLKIKPGWDVDILREVRKNFPNTPLMADANSAYSLKDLEHLKQLDEFDLTMIEQPLAHDDIIDHAILQKAISTPICLDESIHTLEDTRKAVEMGSCKIINIKIGRVGGLTQSKKIHDYCKEQGIPVWCGGMLESGVGRAHNIALTTLSQFILPGDTSSSSRYWEQDIIEPEVIAENGVIKVPDRVGIGYEVNRETIERFTAATKIYQA
ncbi:o-succinylbenzoate synthase [Neobacillus mesonae]|uniref:o-succinylbenzoate synthase n=1 Tax=Neobacillus mesonae TaxID=1193713 RepID=A0A3Q9QZB0_9BACI|nr:o-succinylbenzoate synthase [Neobacillus mesonae]AZU65028.1 o-succinylbenzoate synthase [Neobacillus mesonae]